MAIDNSWYKELVVYQVWCRSFKDGNGDGQGDLLGVLEKLDYIKSIGANAIWFSPIYPSPNADWGYDISDYKDIHPDFGDLDLFKKIVDEAHKRDMKIIMDLVVNHTSSEHYWFKESMKSKDNPYHDYYIWKDGKGGNSKGGKNPPNNWLSIFEGGAWEYNEQLDQFYMHAFAKGQPDLNMDNPKVREEVKDIMRFWLDMGVDGFREDVITFISKDPDFPNGFPIPIACGIEHYNKGPNLMKYLKEFREDVVNHYDCFLVAESPMTNSKDALKFTSGKDKVFDMMINFDHMNADCFMTDTVHLPFSLKRFKKALSSWQENLYGKAWNALYIENHDHPRVISRYGSEKYRKESGKALAVAAYMMSGTPYIYQGQEIGMVNNHLKSLDEFKDVVTFNNEKVFKKFGVPRFIYLKIANLTSRENARTPVQWDDSENAGFTTGTPWFGVNKNYKNINVKDAESDPDSILNFYRELFKVRQNNKIFIYGKYKEYFHKNKKVYCYEMKYEGQKALVVVSFSEKNIKFKAPRGFKLDKDNVILKNYKDIEIDGNDTLTLRPYEAVVFLYK